jgi:hypothetical protein
MIDTLALSLAFLTSGVGTPGPCDLLTRDAAGGLLGQQVTTPTPSGPEPDEDSGGTRTVCVYQAGTRMLIVTRVAFASAPAARDATTRELVGERYSEGEDDFVIKEEPGLGDKAFWAYSQKAAEFIVVKGATVLALALGGMPKEPSTYQAQLRAATVMAAGKL